MLNKILTSYTKLTNVATEIIQNIKVGVNEKQLPGITILKEEKTKLTLEFCGREFEIVAMWSVAGTLSAGKVRTSEIVRETRDDNETEYLCGEVSFDTLGNVNRMFTPGEPDVALLFLRMIEERLTKTNETFFPMRKR